MVSGSRMGQGPERSRGTGARGHFGNLFPDKPGDP